MLLYVKNLITVSRELAVNSGWMLQFFFCPLHDHSYSIIYNDDQQHFPNERSSIVAQFSGQTYSVHVTFYFFLVQQLCLHCARVESNIKFSMLSQCFTINWAYLIMHVKLQHFVQLLGCIAIIWSDLDFKNLLRAFYLFKDYPSLSAQCGTCWDFIAGGENNPEVLYKHIHKQEKTSHKLLNKHRLIQLHNDITGILISFEFFLS